MKLLIVFVIALVLVAHCNAASYDDEVADYAAVDGQEAGPQGVFDEDVEPMVGSPQEPEAEDDVDDSVDIPIVARSCADHGCDTSCRSFGFKHGSCAQACRCYNKK